MIKFFNYPENMIRTSVRTIILTIMKSSFKIIIMIFKVKNEKLEFYLTHFPFITFYAYFSYYLKELWMQLNNLLDKQK